ncbi:unnamed protein product [Spirodela intermedia]|nr:unnamed protein product [Spirodela intermedia]CAA6657169.1 unnamed protein product [Spirodela intermedia]CAA6675739.1 unnamed protein product [Spirodela intermedia]
MFDYFYKLLHAWSPDLEINKYEQLVLTELLRRGHPEPERKIAGGVRSFEVRYHPLWKSRCFFLVRTDGSSDDFSFRKCVDHILPLPDSMKVPDGRKGGGGAARGRGGRGRGRGSRGGR